MQEYLLKGQSSVSALQQIMAEQKFDTGWAENLRKIYTNCMGYSDPIEALGDAI